MIADSVAPGDVLCTQRVAGQQHGGREGVGGGVDVRGGHGCSRKAVPLSSGGRRRCAARLWPMSAKPSRMPMLPARRPAPQARKGMRSEEQTSELQSLMRNTYAVFCFKKNKT